MKYIHPDVIDNGLSHLRGNATRALLLPAYTSGMTYAQALASALVAATITPASFTLSNEGTGRKIVFAGVTAAASKSAISGKPLHVALTDGVARLLLVDSESSHAAIEAGKSYAIPPISYAVAQPPQ